MNVTQFTLAKFFYLLLLPVVIIVSWYILVSTKTLPAAFPSPVAVALVFVSPVKRTELILNLSLSIGRVLLGFSIAALLASTLGILMGWFKRVDDTFDPLLQLVRPIAPFAWIPLTLTWFGASLTEILFIVAYASFFPILLNTITATRNIDRIHVRAALTLGARRFTILRELIIPSATPFMLTGMRIGMGFAWGSIIAAELVNSLSVVPVEGHGSLLIGGIGFLMWNLATIQFDPSELIAAVILIGVIGLAIDHVFRLLQRRLTPWYQSIKVGL